MRKLQNSDFFAGIRLLTALNIKDELRAIVLKSKDEHLSQEDAGYEFLYMVIAKAGEKKNEQEIYNFLAPILELTPQELEVMDPIETCDLILECASVGEWKRFFTRLASFGQKN